MADDPYEAVTCADTVVVLTDWPQFRELDWARVGKIMAGDTVIDTRNHLDPSAWIAQGCAGTAWAGAIFAMAVTAPRFGLIGGCRAGARGRRTCRDPQADGLTGPGPCCPSRQLGCSADLV